MKISSILYATIVASGVAGVTSLASAMPAAPAKTGLDIQQAHAVQICEHGRCFWTRNHWGYGGGWRGDRWGYGGGWRGDRWGRDWDHDRW